MEYSVQVEKPSTIVRKLTVRVAAKEVASRLERGLADVQRKSNLKGFRPGQAPISVIRQFYGEDVRHQVFHNLIDESFQTAVRDHKLRAVGSPKIETPDHKTGEGAHDHSITEDKDLTYVATVEIMPEIEVKNYTGSKLTRETVEIKDADVEKVVQSLRDAHAEMVPATSGLANADGTAGSRPVRKGDFVDMKFSGGIVTDDGIEERPGMKGERTLEVGSDSLIPGFEDHLVGMRAGDTKTFRVPFPKDFHEASMAGKDSEFTVAISEVKEKRLPELDDEFAKTAGYESVSDLRAKARDYLLKERTTQVDHQVRGQLMEDLISKNPFDLPQALVESQTRALAQDWAEELKRQGADEAMIRDAITRELDQLRKRADSQVRASLILEAIAKKENITVTAEDFENEVKSVAAGMKVDEEKVREFYAKNSDRKDDFEFRLRQDRTVKFLLDKAKIQSKS